MGKKTLGRPRHRWENFINVGLKIQDGTMRNGLIWLTIETSGGLFCTR
jgi:hypothetical protein